MRVRYTKKPHIEGDSSTFNIHGLSEVIVHFPEGDVTSEEVRELEVFLEKPLPSSAYKTGSWVNMLIALRENDVIPGNHNVHFREPHNQREKERGWYDD